MGFFQRMALRIQRFMYGRYGGDVLNIVLLIVGLLWSSIWSRTLLWPIAYLSWVFLGWAIFRTLSRNLVKRRAENEWFLRTTRPIKNWFQRVIARFKDKEHRRFSCPKCKQICRVPRGKGKIRITCPQCGETFIRKT